MKYIIENGERINFEDDAPNDLILQIYPNAIIKGQKKETAEKSSQTPTMMTQPFTTIKNSSFQLATDLVQPIIHPIETSKNLYTLGKGIFHLLTPGMQPSEEVARAVGGYFAENYGSKKGLLNKVNTDPMGFIADVSVVLGGGAFLIGKTAGKSNKIVQKAAEKAAVMARAIDPINIPMNAANLSNKVLKLTSGTLTGVGRNVIGLAYEAGKNGGEILQKFVDNIGDKVPATALADEVIDGVGLIIDKHQKVFGKTIEGLKLQKKKIDPKIVQKIVDDAIGSFKQNGMNLITDAGDLAKVKLIEKAATDFVNNPQWHNAFGLDAFKKQIQNMSPPPTQKGGGNVQGRLIKKITKDVKSQIIKRAPEYKGLMKWYEEAKILEQNLQQEILGAGTIKNPNRVLKKLTAIASDAGEVNFAGRANLIKSIESDIPNIRTSLAGQALRPIIPKGVMNRAQAVIPIGLAGFSNPALYALAPLASPRLVGNVAMAAGQIARPISKAYGKIPQGVKRGTNVLSNVLKAQRPVYGQLTSEEDKVYYGSQ